MTDRKYDIVLYGASGFTGKYVLEAAANHDFFHRKFAIAGRDRNRLEKTLHEVSDLVGKDLSKVPIVIADSKDANQLAEMAKSTRVIINVVGPYRLYGEAVVKAAVENGASHVDISGEPAWLELMQQKYGETAKQNHVYIVGACGWDSIPCDLGTNFLKKNFQGTLCYAETFAQVKSGKAGYSFNAGTYQTLILGLSQMKNDNLGAVRRAIMPEKIDRPKYRPPKRPMLWKNTALDSYVLPFMGADKSVVQRSQYYDAVVNKAYPVTIETYLLVKSYFWAILLVAWLAIFNFAVKFDFTRKILQNYPGFCSGYMFKESGPTREQAKGASFIYWLIGKGWDGDHLSEDPPRKTLVVRCDGPDAGYIATAGCVLSSAVTILEDRDKLPANGGVYTTTAAFKDTKIYDRLASFDVVFSVDLTVHADV